MYNCLKSHDNLVQGQSYPSLELQAIYHESTILTLVNAGVLEVVKESKTK